MRHNDDPILPWEKNDVNTDPIKIKQYVPYTCTAIVFAIMYENKIKI